MLPVRSNHSCTSRLRPSSTSSYISTGSLVMFNTRRGCTIARLHCLTTDQQCRRREDVCWHATPTPKRLTCSCVFVSLSPSLSLSLSVSFSLSLLTTMNHDPSKNKRGIGLLISSLRYPTPHRRYHVDSAILRYRQMRIIGTCDAWRNLWHFQERTADEE